MTIHVLLAVDDQQVIGCAVAMRSILENRAPRSHVHFHVMTNDVPADDRDKLRRTIEDGPPDATISLYDVDVSPFEHLMRSKLVSHTTYARLLLDEVLPREVKRVIYLDCDMVVQCEIDDAWRFPLEGRTVAAVANGHPDDTRRNQERLGLAEARYFNAGFAVIDVERWRGLGVSRRAVERATAIGDRLILHDQDAMNCALVGDWVELPREWNVGLSVSDWLTEDSRAVFHYWGAPKPWHVDYNGRFPELYQRYLALTPYAAHEPWNPFGLGAMLTRLRRRLPYVPAALRMAKGFLRRGRD